MLAAANGAPRKLASRKIPRTTTYAPRTRASKRKRGNDLRYTSGEQSPQPVYFTQEDPIGLAGGMNLYGYADGDPINNADPFGLSACLVLPISCPILGGFALGGPLGWAAAGAMLVIIFDESGGPMPAGTPSMAAAADATAFSARRSGRSLKKEWEEINGATWPDGCVAHHICPLADGGPDEASNIEPKTPGQHVEDHKKNGDFKRWGARSKGKGKGEKPETEEPKTP